MSFDLLAPHYTWMEAVLAGRRLQRARVAWLETLEGHGDILIVGVGHGHFLRRCALRFPQAHITGVDGSARMLATARARMRRTGADSHRLEFVHATLPEWEPPRDRFDAIVTHFFLDCFPSSELPSVIGALAAAARPTAEWLIADFAVPARGLARQRAKAVHALMYAFFRRVTKIRAHRVVDPAPFLSAAGFKLAGRRTSEWGLLRSDRWIRGFA